MAKKATKKQIAALKYVVFHSSDGTELTKRVMALLIDGSECLTKDVCLSLVAEREGYSDDCIHQAALGLGEMMSTAGSTHINQILLAMGHTIRFSAHYGDFDTSRESDPFSAAGQFAGSNPDSVTDPETLREGMPMRYTFWLARKSYSREAAYIEATRETLEQINLRKPGLYPEFEPD